MGGSCLSTVARKSPETSDVSEMHETGWQASGGASPGLENSAELALLVGREQPQQRRGREAAGPGPRARAGPFAAGAQRLVTGQLAARGRAALGARWQRGRGSARHSDTDSAETKET